jgi:Na+/H+ antiporter NhaD/arsenite permease-like protein
LPSVRLGILIATYLLIAVQQLPGLRLNRPAASLLGAVAMVTIGGLPMREAYAAIDMDVLVFLLGVLLLTGFLEMSGFFEWAAAHIVRRAHSLHALLASVVLLSGLLAALFVNDTVCLVLTPLILAVVRPLGVRATPFLLAVALASNVGSAMTPVGNPQNMLIAVASHIHFARFVGALALPSLGALAIVYGVIALVHRRDLPELRRIEDASELPSIDRPLVIKSLVCFGAALAGWLAGYPLPLVAIASGAVLVAISGRDPSHAFAKVEWELLLFFGALFVVMRGVRDLPLVVSLTSAAGAHLDGAPVRDATIVSGAMLALSNLVSNVPAVLLWIPVVPTLANAQFVWLVMAMSSTFAGNLTLIGSMANLIVAERAAARGEPIAFLDYLKVGVPATLLTLVWGIAALLLLR